MSLVGVIGKGFGPTTASNPPTAPVISVIDNRDGTGGVISIVGSDAGSTNRVYSLQHGDANWTLQGTQFDDGNVIVAPGNGSYWWFVESETAGGIAASNLVYQPLTDIVTGNPFVKVFNALWTLLESDPEFTSRIKPGNRVKYNQPLNRDPIKQNITTDDTPEFAISFTTGTANIPNTSSSSMIITTYQLIINTGDFRINEIANVISWIVACNIARWIDELTALTWKDETFVKRVSPTSIASGESDAIRNRGINGWIVLWTIDVEMHFKTSHLVFSE